MVHRQAKVEAARRGETLTQFIEDAIRARIADSSEKSPRAIEVEERNQLMEALLRKTAHFRMGPKPTRDEMNDRSALR